MSKSNLFDRTATFLVLACSLCVAACGGATTQFEQVWREPRANIGSLQRVVTLYDSHDGAMRRTVEDAMARKFRQRGIDAVPAYAVLQASELEDRPRAKTSLAAKGFDGVVEIRLISTENYPGDSYGGAWFGSYDGYWGATWPYAYDNYVFDSPVVRVETNFYSLRDNALVWSARSKTVDAEDTNEVIDEVTSLVATTLERRGTVTATARR
jgi:hypothetical protein